jgi:hypothetical protein
MPRQKPRAGIIAAAGVGADDEVDLLALIELSPSGGTCDGRDQCRTDALHDIPS